jgi:predicted nicotinamide N-methyase
MIDWRGLSIEVLVDFEAESARLYAHRARQGLSADPDLSPMFGVIWPSAEVAADWIATQAQGRAVLELGCGLGLPSLLAAKTAARVRATDLHPGAGPLLARNAARNNVVVDYQPLDFRTSGVDRTWDRVIATDVLFAYDMPAVVAQAFADHLAPDGVGLLVDPGRAWSDLFPKEAESRGLSVDIDVVGELFAIELRWRST